MSKSIVTRKDDRGVQHYTISVPCNAQGTVVSWAMHDDGDTAIRAAREIIAHHKSWQAAKTAEMNRQLNDEIPWFRCLIDAMSISTITCGRSISCTTSRSAKAGSRNRTRKRR